MEFFFVPRHDADDAVLVQIMGDILHFQTAGGKFFQTVGKQGGVIGFEVDLPALPDGATVFVQKCPVGQTALGVLFSSAMGRGS